MGLNFTKLPFVIKIFILSFLSGCFTQVLLYKALFTSMPRGDEFIHVQLKSMKFQLLIKSKILKTKPGRVAQSVTCLATDACLTADPGVASSIPAQYHTFVEIDHEIISTVILLPSADLFKKGCCQLQAKVCAQITG